MRRLLRVAGSASLFLLSPLTFVGWRASESNRHDRHDEGSKRHGQREEGYHFGCVSAELFLFQQLSDISREILNQPVVAGLCDGGFEIVVENVGDGGVSHVVIFRGFGHTTQLVALRPGVAFVAHAVL